MTFEFTARLALLGLLVCTGAGSLAQAVHAGNGPDNTEWAEEQTPPPPQFSKDRLIPIEMPPHVSVKIGVDPQTIVVGADGVVRYVLLMTNATGTTHAVYEGIRCITDEVKTYARLGSSGDWSLVQDPAWKALNATMPSHHARAFAVQGACQNRLATSNAEIIKVLKYGNKPLQSRKGN